MKVRGKVTEFSSQDSRLRLRSEAGESEVRARIPEELRRGDWVECDGEVVRILTRTTSESSSYMDQVLDPRRLRALAVREKTEAAIREFFRSREFREVRTPSLVPNPGMEPHIRPFAVKPFSRDQRTRPEWFLPTSPEFAMKRLLAGGLERIFQMAPSFRDEPVSSTHLPEFTMLEWYRAFSGYEEIMLDTEELFAQCARAVLGKTRIPFQGREIELATPWPRLRVRDLFLEHAGVDLVKSSERDLLARECERLSLKPVAEDDWDDLYFRIWLNVVEPMLPADRACFVLGYPPSQAALATTERLADGTVWARRVEAYAGGLELGNGFDELTDARLQRERFEKDMRLRERAYGPEFPRTPQDEGFLEALAQGIPPSGGIAVGLDRLIMLLADEKEIGFTSWLPLTESHS